MMLSKRRLFRLWNIGITLFLMLLMGCSPAQASLDLSGRISRLESEFFMVRSQINSLEAQVSRLSNRLDFPIMAPTEPARIPFPRPEVVESPHKEQFDRLATLLIELKEQINSLETRFSDLETQFSNQ
jgi:BMFP domain-containing protein YqiC